ERPTLALGVLIGFMPFACDQHDILVISPGNRPANSLFPIMEHLKLGISGHASQDILNDLLGRLGPWVIIRHNQLGAVARCSTGHQRSLGAVAITATTEYTPESAGLMLLTCPQRLLQCIGRMGIIDDHQGAGRGPHWLHAT